MPRNQITRDEIQCHVLKMKKSLDAEDGRWVSNPKELAHKYLNKVLEKLKEYRF